MFPLIAEVPADHDIVIDFYVWHSGPARRSGGYAAGSPVAAQQAGFPRPIRRIVVAVAGPGRGEGMGGMQHFTYRPQRKCAMKRRNSIAGSIR